MTNYESGYIDGILYERKRIIKSIRKLGYQEELTEKMCEVLEDIVNDKERK